MRRIAILALGSFDWQVARMITDVIRYSEDTIVAIIDTAQARVDAGQVLGDSYGQNIPLVENVAAALAYRPDTLLSVTPAGGQPSEAWRREVLHAIQAHLNIMNGSHYFLSDDSELAEAAKQHHVQIWDLLSPPKAFAMRPRKELSHLSHRPGSYTVYCCGSDCSVGEMATAIELDREAQRRGLSSAFAATGLTGMIISGHGLHAGQFISDFIVGGVEGMVLEFTKQYDWVFVEGQGSLYHPAYSTVTLGTLHGAAPDLLVLCQQAGHRYISGYDIPIPPLLEMRKMYEEAASWVKPAPVVAVALSTFGLSDAAARAVIAETASETGLATSDPARFGAGPILDALLAHV